MKIVKNACYGGFCLSNQALFRLSELTGKSVEQCHKEYDWEDLNRSAPELIQVVEELGPKANGRCANLVIVEIPDDVNWFIEESDGWETVEEVHRSW